jgi:O-acetyl-ADP-ribose deacetylase (regulator of RNase III)
VPLLIEAVAGDLTRQHVDAIVNAANSTLLGGGGVDGAIHAAAGPALLEECRRVRRTTYPDGLPVGQAVATGAGQLPARWVIHTVGPNRNRGQDDPAQLASCFTASLDIAAELGARSVAFPAISAGAYGWAVEDVARIAVAAVRRWAAKAPDDGGDEVVRFVPFGPRADAAFRAALEEPAGS